MKQCQPDIFAEEIKDLEQRDPKTAKKTRHLWDESAEAPEEKKQQNPSKKKQNKKNKKRGKKGQNANAQTSAAAELSSQVAAEQQTASDQLRDIESKMSALSMQSGSESPSKSILKNRANPNLEKERELLAASQSQSNEDSEVDSDEEEQRRIAEFMGGGGNMNRARGAPSRRDSKQKKRGKGKKGRGARKGGKKGRGDEDEDEDKEEDEDEAEERESTVKFYEEAAKSNAKRKIPKAAVEVSLENRKGNKKVTVIRGFLEKSADKEKRITSEFRKKFATSAQITFQTIGAEKGPRQVVLMGDKQYDFMKYLHEKFPKAGKLLFYKSKKFGMTPAVDPNHGFVLPPPGKKFKK